MKVAAADYRICVNIESRSVLAAGPRAHIEDALRVRVCSRVKTAAITPLISYTLRLSSGRPTATGKNLLWIQEAFRDQCL